FRREAAQPGVKSLSDLLEAVQKGYVGFGIGYDVGIQLGRISPDRGTLEYLRANAPSGLRLTANGGAENLGTRSGPAITGNADLARSWKFDSPPLQLQLSPGDDLFLFTDGCYEFEAKDGTAFGKRKFCKLLEDVPQADRTD